MFERIGYEVVRLERIKFGQLSLSDLQDTTYRELTPEEIHKGVQ
jgi:16S rRNA U516 pseudouridylate synthase RsuA-like enzyme